MVPEQGETTNVIAPTPQIPTIHRRALDILGLRRSQITPSQRSLEIEVETYLNNNSTETDPLEFWQVCCYSRFMSIFANVIASLKENQQRYPTIFALAMDILPIQASAVPCERIFSSAKETMAARRNRIFPDLMEALQLLKFTLRNGRSLDFTSGLGYMDELHEMERQESEKNDVPEDVTSFIQSLLSRTS